MDKRIEMLVDAARTNSETREAVIGLKEFFEKGAALMREHGVSSVPELPPSAIRELLVLAEETLPEGVWNAFMKRLGTPN